MNEPDNIGNRNERNESDDEVVGVFGLAIAILAACCFALGFVTWLLTWLAIAPLAGLGLWCSSFARGGLRTLGIVLNLPQLALGAAFTALWLLFFAFRN